MKVVEIVWLDAASEDAYIELEVAEKLSPIERRNVGYLIYSDTEKEVLCFGIIENFFKGKTATDKAMVIPQSMVKSMKIIKD